MNCIEKGVSQHAFYELISQQKRKLIVESKTSSLTRSGSLLRRREKRKDEHLSLMLRKSCEIAGNMEIFPVCSTSMTLV